MTVHNPDPFNRRHADNNAILSRRNWLIWSGLAASAPIFWGRSASAAAAGDTGAMDMTSTQGAGYYRFAVGALDVAIVTDGQFLFAQPYPIFGGNASKDAVAAQLESAFIPYDHAVAHIHTLLIRAGGRVILVDTGCGKLFGPTTGRLLTHLARLGVQPDDVTDLVITHAHGDHIGGLLNDAGAPTFAKAVHHIQQVEYDFWTGDHPDLSRSGIPAASQVGMAATANKILSGARDKMRFLNGKTELMEGVTLEPAPGHTPGHQVLWLSSQGQTLLYWTDLAHHEAIVLPHPEWYVSFDTDRDLGVTTRRQYFARAAAERLLVAGAHLHFPAVGHVRAVGDGYQWTPVIWEWA